MKFCLTERKTTINITGQQNTENKLLVCITGQFTVHNLTKVAYHQAHAKQLRDTEKMKFKNILIIRKC